MSKSSELSEETSLNKSDEKAKASFGKKIRQAFTKVLATGLALFLTMPAVQNSYPQVEAAKISRNAGKKNSKRNRKKSNNNKITIENDTKIKDNNYINQRRIISKSAQSEKNLRLIEFAAILGFSIASMFIGPNKNNKQSRQLPLGRRQNPNPENSVLTVYVSFYTQDGNELLYNGKERFRWEFYADNHRTGLNRAIENRFGLQRGSIDSITIRWQTRAYLKNGDDIKVTLKEGFLKNPLFSYKNQLLGRQRLEREREREQNQEVVLRQQLEQQRLERKQEQDQEAIQHRQQRDLETPEAKKERKNRQDELRKDNETPFEYFSFHQDTCDLPFEILEFDVLFQEHPEYLDEIRLFFEEIIGLNILNLKEFSHRYFPYPQYLFHLLEDVIKGRPHHKEIALFHSSFYKLVSVILNFKESNQTSDLKFDLASLQIASDDFKNIQKDRFLKKLSTPMIEAIDRMTSRLQDILQERNGVDRINEIPAENLPLQGVLLNNRYAPLGIELNSNSIGCLKKISLCSDTVTGNKVAIKTNRFRDFPAYRFEKLKNIESPYVSKIIDCFPKKGTVAADIVMEYVEADIVMEYVEDGIPLKYYIYNVGRDKATILRLCKQLAEGAIALSNSGVCYSFGSDFRENVLVDKNGNLKYVDCDEQWIGTSEDAAASNFDCIKNVVFDILKSNFPTTLYKKLLEKMRYTLKIKEERKSPIFDYHRGVWKTRNTEPFCTGSVLYNSADVVEVPSDLRTLLSKLEELQSENCSAIELQ